MTDKPVMPTKETIVKSLKNKAVMKQKVFKNTNQIFQDLKKELEKLGKELQKDMARTKPKIIINYNEIGDFEADFSFAGDTLFFMMHTNVFEFDKSHTMWNSTYLQEDELRAYCGMINIYNFLTDSFRYNRVNDAGYLVARVFVNQESHFFVEGRGQLGTLFNDFSNAVIDKQAMRDIIEASMAYSMEFDLLTPPFDAMKEVTLQEMQEHSTSMKIKTGKRLGFQFKAEDKQPE